MRDASPPPVLSVRGLSKSFTLHTQGGIRIPVFAGLDLDVYAGECVALHGPSGAGKSSLMRTIFANYRAESGQILVLRDGSETVDLVGASPRQILEVRRRMMSFVSQFLRVIPRVPAEDIVAEPLVALGHSRAEALESARAWLDRLAIPERLWRLAPATFSGGEQQRVNIARGMLAGHPILLLDEPTASLDSENQTTVCRLIREAKARGAAIIGIFHEPAVRGNLADRLFDLAPYRGLAA